MTVTQYFSAGVEEDQRELQRSPGLMGICEVPVKRLLIVTNRLPITVDKGDNGGLRVKPRSGGMVSALSPILRSKTCLWIGWPGGPPDVLRNGHLDRAGEQIGCTFKPVTLSEFIIPEKEFDDYYLGFSNNVLWPLFHGFPQFCRSNFGYWYTYQEVNRKFAHKLAGLSRVDDYILVQDYHLILLAKELRDIGVKRKTGFLLRTPFPSPDILEHLPWRTEIIEALLDYDLVGFQTELDKKNFIRCVESISGLDCCDRGKLTLLSNSSHRTAVGVFPVGIDVDDFETQAVNQDVEEKVNQIRQAASHCRIIIGVDQLDYSRGIPQKLRAYNTFLERFESIHNRVTMIQLVVPGNDRMPENQAVKQEIEGLVSEINDKFGNENWTPVSYNYCNPDGPELVAYYRAADIALITPLKDGMNIVAKEYCASNIDNEGVLILSQFSGAADQLCENALIVDPYDTDVVANTIFKAYQMPAVERRLRMHKLRQSIKKQDIHWWLRRFIEPYRWHKGNIT